MEIQIVQIDGPCLPRAEIISPYCRPFGRKSLPDAKMLRYFSDNDDDDDGCTRRQLPPPRADNGTSFHNVFI